MPTHLDSIFFTVLDPLSCWLASLLPVSGVDCPCPCPVTNCQLQAPLSNSLLTSPSASDHGENSSPKLFVWFRAKTYKGIVCLVGHLHSVTIGLCVTSGEFPRKFSKSCFYSCVRSSWLAAFSLAFAVFFLLLSSFTVCHTILDCQSSTESLILLIRFCMYSVCSLRYMIVNLFCAFLSFRVLILVRFLLLHLEAVFTSARFVLTANISHGTLFSSLFS